MKLRKKCINYPGNAHNFGLFSENITPLGQNRDGRDKYQLCISKERQGHQVPQNNLKVDIQVAALLII